MLALTACQSAGLYIANLGLDEDSYIRYQNIAYGSEPWQWLDAYQPTEANAPSPVVLFFYGGGWTSGSKDDYRFAANRLVKAGFVVVIPDYAKYPPATYPDFVQDAALASRWIYNHIAAYGGDVSNVHVMGHSAGAHTGAMLVSNTTFLDEVGLNPSFFNSLVGLAGPYNFNPTSRKYKAIFGPPEQFPQMKVSNFIDGNEPPMLLLHGQNDSTVSARNMESLRDAIIEAGGSVDTRLYADINHITIIGIFSPMLTFEQTVIEDTIDFLRSHAD